MGEKTTTTGEVTFSATFAESKTTPTTKETDNSQKESVQVNQGAGQACQITFDVLSSQNTLDYDIPIVLTGTFRSAYPKCDPNGDGLIALLFNNTIPVTPTAVVRND